MTASYDPFVSGPILVGERTVQLQDKARGNREFPCEIWYPAASEGRDAPQLNGRWPLVVFSHSSGGNRRQSTFLTIHLASYGYIVAAMDHSEIVAPELSRTDGETSEQSAARVQKWISNRVPDVRFLLDHLLNNSSSIEENQIGIIGHSFGGWTALAATEKDSRLRAVVALAPAGSSRPVRGVIPATLTFAWGRDVPTLYLVAELDVPTPIEGMVDLFERTPSSKQMVILRRADHAHFMDDMESIHEGFRLSASTGEYAWMARAMRPFGDLCPAESAKSFTRGLALAHFDAYLKGREDARLLLGGDLKATLSRRGIDGTPYHL
jgi:dienelactone hydrolase